MSRFTWTIASINSELGIDFNTIRRLVHNGTLIPDEWDRMSKSDRITNLANRSLIFRASDIKQFIKELLSLHFSSHNIHIRIDENTQLMYEVLAEVKEIRKDFDINMEPMNLNDIAVELKVSKKTLYNYIVKPEKRNGTATLVYPPRNPQYNLPLRLVKGEYMTERFEFLRQKRGLRYDDFKNLEKYSNGLKLGNEQS